MTRRTRTVALACALLFALPALAFARVAPVPRAQATYLLGGKMIRGEVGVNASDGTLHDYRIDRGRLTKRYAAGSLTLSERDGTKATIKVAPSARVFLSAKSSNLRALRPGMQVAVSRDGDLPADSVYASGPRGTPVLPYATISYLLGPRLLRAEVALRSADNVLHDFLLDHGRIKQITGPTLILREADGTNVTIPTSPSVHVKVNGQNGTYTQLHKGMMATTMHDGDKPADQVWATGK